MAKSSGWRVSQDTDDMEYIGTSGNRPAVLGNSKHIKSVVETSKLPPAVATVAPDVIRNYLHRKRVENYLIGDTLGEGSFAKVKEAFHVLIGEKVAMKIIDKRKAQQDPYVAKNFRREAKLLQMVRHPSILQLYEVIETDTNLYLITELCSGGELMNYIYKKQRLDEDETHKFMQQIVSAVDHLHKAGIIHRDLKVENMLLDSHMDVKIIDFGLSNEEYVEGENGQLHCNTQCGSPAYAAPELLGHKEYGKEVDIWSIGVNMYAMLSGCLPYTVEPFNITALHAKMLENKMNPIPNHLSVECKDLLRCLLRPNPSDRITMEDIMAHPWMNRGSSLPFGPAPFPNKITPDEIKDEIIEHMVNVLKIRPTVDQLKQELLQTRSTNATAVYSLLAARLARYLRHTRSRSSIKRKRTKSSSSRSRERDTNQDNPSTIARPQRSRPGSRKISPASRQNTTPLTSHSKEKSLSSPSVVEEIITAVQAPTSISRSSRRKSVPPAVLEKELAEFNARKKGEESLPAKKQWQTYQYQPRQTTSALPEVRLRKRSAPNAPVDYMTHIDKEALTRMQPQGADPNSATSMTYNNMPTASRRRTMPPMELKGEIAGFRQRKAKEGGHRTHTSQAAERRPGTSSTLPRISSLPKDAHLLPLQQQHHQQRSATQNERYLKRTLSTPPNKYEYDDTEETVPVPLTRNVHTYPAGLSSIGEKHSNPPPPSQATTAWQKTVKQTLSKSKSKLHRVFAGLTMRAPLSSSKADSRDYEVGEVTSEEGKRKVSPAGPSGDTNDHLPSLYSDTQHGSPQKRVYPVSNRSMTTQ